MRPICFDKAVVIERKGSLDELATNLTKERARIKEEFSRLHGIRSFLLIENAEYRDIIQHNYRSQYQPKAFIASLWAMQHEYNLNIVFTPKEYAGFHIHMIMYYYVRACLLGRMVA